MLELPFNLSGRRKNANLDVTFVLALTSSIVCRLGDEGNRFRALCTRSIDAMCCSFFRSRVRKRGPVVGPGDREDLSTGVDITICIQKRRIESKKLEGTRMSPDATLSADLDGVNERMEEMSSRKETQRTLR
jgi:hypothetical protein